MAGEAQELNKLKVIYELGSNDTSKFDVTYEKIETNDTVVTLCASTLDNTWKHPVNELARVKDDGDGVNVLLDGLNPFRLNYGQLEYLRLILHALAETNQGYGEKLNKYIVTPYTKSNIKGK